MNQITIKESILIRPAKPTPEHRLRTTVLDRVAPVIFSPFVYFYKKPKEATNFFEASSVKEGLSKVLVPYYPFAGRLMEDKEGEFDIQCNGEGAVYVEAETSCAMAEFVFSESSLKLKQLFPALRYSKDQSVYPLFVMQITRFKCGGVSVGGMFHHTLVDGFASVLFNNALAEVIRGSPISIPPAVDRAILDTGEPTTPTFHHTEYDPVPTMPRGQSPGKRATVSTAVIEVSPEQMKTLRQKYSEKDDGSMSTTKYSRFEIVAAHIWRCACKARALPPDQLSRVNIPVNGRYKMNPRIPAGYIGNVVFFSALTATSGVIQSESLNDAVERVRKSLGQMDDRYMTSALACLKQVPDITVTRRRVQTFGCPNLVMSNLLHTPARVDFGWGEPVFGRPVNTVLDGLVYVIPSPKTDGSLVVVIELETHSLQLFKKLFYEFLLQPQDMVRSRY